MYYLLHFINVEGARFIVLRLQDSDGFDEIDDLVALLLRQVAEFLHRTVGVAHTTLVLATVPHDGLHHVAGPTVVQPLHATATLSGQPTSPQRSGAAPARADVVLHPQAMLHKVGVGPYLLVRIARHVAVGGKELGRILDVVVARLPRRTVAGCAANLCKQALALLEIFGGGVARCGHGQATVPYHQVLILRVGHLGVELLAGEIGIDVVL